MNLGEAIAFAARAHEGQLYHGNLQGVRFPTPYIFHPLRVMLACPPEVWPLAVLHDVLEDTGTFPEELSEDEVQALMLLSREPGESYDAYIERIAEAEGWPGAAAQVVKIADLRDNLSRTPTLEQRERYRGALERLSGLPF